MERIAKTIKLPVDVLQQMHPLMGKFNLNFTGFVMEAIKNYIRVLNYKEGIGTSFGAWEANDHAELKNGVDSYIRDMRKSRTF